MSLNILQLPKVIGHRGACGYAPENTLASMCVAQKLGAQWVEVDVMLTQDDKAIIMHDLTLDHTTNSTGEVAKTLYSQIAKLDAGSWFNKKFTGEHVPTLTELLQCLAELNLKLNLEIKPTPGKEIETAEKIMKILSDSSSLYLVPLISSATVMSLTTVRKINDKIPLGFIAHTWYKNWQSLLDKFNGISMHVNHKVLTQNRVQEIKQTGRLVLAYTVNNPKRANELFAWGVDAVFSDYPDKILKKVFSSTTS